MEEFLVVFVEKMCELDVEGIFILDYMVEQELFLMFFVGDELDWEVVKRIF